MGRSPQGLHGGGDGGGGDHGDHVGDHGDHGNHGDHGGGDGRRAAFLEELAAARKRVAQLEAEDKAWRRRHAPRHTGPGAEGRARSEL